MVGSKPASATETTVRLTWEIMDQMPIPVPLGKPRNHHAPLPPTKDGVLPTSGHRGRQVPVIVGCTRVHLTIHARFPAFWHTPAARPTSPPHLTHLLLVQCHEIPTRLCHWFLPEGFPAPNLTGGHLICNPASATFRIELKILMTNIRSARFVF